MGEPERITTRIVPLRRLNSLTMRRRMMNKAFALTVTLLLISPPAFSQNAPSSDQRDFITLPNGS